MKRTITLNESRMTNKKDALAYLQELFVFDEPSNNLDALYDDLSEVKDEVKVILTPECVRTICKDPGAYRVLMVLGKAGEENPHLHILFRS